MSSNSSAGSFSLNTILQTKSWDTRDTFIFVFNGALIAFVAVCGAELLYTLLRGGQSREALWIRIILTGIAYGYGLTAAKISVSFLERENRATNISRIIRFYGMLYSLGVSVVYWIVIFKLAEKDYKYSRYFQYIFILATSFLAANFYIGIPKLRERWVLITAILVSNVAHVISIIYQYVICDACVYIYFFMDLAILIGMAGAALYTLWSKTEPSRFY